MTTQHLTVADLRAARGRRSLTMIRVATWDQLEAAERAGVDLVSVPPEMMADPRFRLAAPTVFAVPAMNFYDLGDSDDFVRWAYRMLRAGADAVQTSAGLPTIRRLAEDNIPVIGHIGLTPARGAWPIDDNAADTTTKSAMSAYLAARALEAAGAFGAVIETVAADAAAEIAKRTSLFLISAGSGSGGDCQYLVAEDILGESRGLRPRHAKAYRDLATEYDRLQADRVAAFAEFVADVGSGAYPGERHLVTTDPAELARFVEQLEAEDRV
ncbi:MAG TPA: 3-methyl-2-oxobutanoate hydroxymethyltransferase [Propionicimonas sp.]|jgi:3-methyl-2-oxobutanoate hydroxymethyltransferase